MFALGVPQICGQRRLDKVTRQLMREHGQHQFCLLGYTRILAARVVPAIPLYATRDSMEAKQTKMQAANLSFCIPKYLTTQRAHRPGWCDVQYIKLPSENRIRTEGMTADGKLGAVQEQCSVR